MLIGELAAQTATTTRALRYYEEQGLLESDRSPSGYRVYGPHAVTRVRNVRDLLASGFTVDNVKSFVRYLDTDLPEVFEYSPLWAGRPRAGGPPGGGRAGDRATPPNRGAAPHRPGAR
ncbi:MerR family transcriptional regulator, partial [Streptomyces sp. NPDC057280]|uniref:MerR family transcriptional regulator n=1 Tax=Streptomyces sp. NPDC057280 TaxID=3346081 RepID=UPI003632AC48